MSNAFLFNSLENSSGDNQHSSIHKPLAARMRPTTFQDIVGQDSIVGENSLLVRLVATNQFGSLIFFGPPGSGKTSLAEVIAKQTCSRFVRLNAVMSNVTELREVLKVARYHGSGSTVLFIDELHRFNKSQQDLLLPDIEEGVIRFIGATTHNPSFYVNAPLLSRSHLFKLEPISLEAIQKVLQKALKETRGLGGLRLSADEAMLGAIARMVQGDLRKGLNILETIALSQPMGSHLKEDLLKAFAQERHIRYDEDEHYDTISAFIKSIRGSDPDAAVYWMAKMLEAGEDPLFIARRLLISASEDVGLADSRGLSLATACFQACQSLGMPECAIPLAHVTIFLATAPKSNSAYLALKKAQTSIRQGVVQPVPIALRDSSTVLSKQLGYGKEYLYSHDYPESISGQNYMMEPINLYTPKASGAEASIATRLEYWKKLKEELLEQSEVFS